MGGEEKLELEITSDTKDAIKGLKKIDKAVAEGNKRAKKSSAELAKFAKARARTAKFNHRATMRMRKNEATALAMDARASVKASRAKARAVASFTRKVNRSRRKQLASAKKLRATSLRYIRTLSRVAVAALAVGAATAAMVSKKAISSAISFQSAVLKMRTMLNITEDQVGSLNERLEEQAKAWGISAMEQASAGYKIASGVTKDLDEAMKFLTATNKLAVVGFDALEGSTATTIKVMRAAGFDFARVDEITKKLWATVRSGILETSELEGAMGKLGTAFEFVPFEQVSAAYSVLTTKLGSTEEAATALNKLILALTSTTSKGARAARENGIEFGIVALQQKGLIGILKELDILHDKDIAAWKETFPELRAFRGAAGLTGKSLVEMGDNLSTFDSKMRLFDKLLVEVMKSTRKEIDKTREAWHDVLRDIGEETLPGLTKVLRDDLMPILREWATWVEDNKDDIKNFFDDAADSAGHYARVLQLVSQGRVFKALELIKTRKHVKEVLAAQGPTLADEVGSRVGSRITKRQIDKAREIRGMTTINLAPTYVNTKDPEKRLLEKQDFMEEVTAR